MQAKHILISWVTLHTDRLIRISTNRRLRTRHKPLSQQTDKKNKKLTPQTYRDVSTFRRQRAAHERIEVVVCDADRS